MTHCSICHALEVRRFVKHGYPVNQCSGCGVYRTVLPKSYNSMIKHYYSKGYFTGSKFRAGYADYEQDARVVKLNANMFLNILRKYKTSGTLLDVGCATGLFMQQAQFQGYQVHGIDISEYAVGIAKTRFPGKVSVATLEKSNYKPNSFDIIVMLDVIEHLDQPVKVIRFCHKLLKKNGLLMINTGNTDSQMAKLEGARWHYFIPPQHVFYYSAANLKQLLLGAGFRVKAIQTTGKHLSLRYLLNLIRTINKSSFADWVFSKVHHNLLGKIALYINLRDNMTIIASKT